jgi:aminoglycoside phosphotransferase (APT) family kinase protein
MTKAEDAKFELLAQRALANSKLLRTRELKGGVSAQVTALEIERPDGLTQKMIVRRHGVADLKRNPHIAEDEFNLLHILQDEGLPTPAPYYVDRFCEVFPTPSIVVEYIEGETEVASLDRTSVVSQLATYLARIHNITAERVDLSFLPGQEAIYAKTFKERPTKLDESLDEGRIRDTLEAVWPVMQHNKNVLLHGDYWPGNTLWKDGRLVGIIDWEDARVGDPLEDLANSRLEIVWAFGIEAMHGFTRQYKSTASIDFTNLPYWDLCAALRPAFKLAQWASDAAREKAIREGHGLFVAQAFEKLAL